MRETLAMMKVKRKLDWDSMTMSNHQAPTIQKVAGNEKIAAVNGKSVRVRTYSLSNAMKQSLMAPGCSETVAYAAMAAYQTKSEVMPGGPGMGTTASIKTSALNLKQSPTALAIVKSPARSNTPTLHKIVTLPQASPLGGSFFLKDENTFGTPINVKQPVVFKTPATPKSSPYVSTQQAPPSHQPQLLQQQQQQQQHPQHQHSQSQSVANSQPQYILVNGSDPKAIKIEPNRRMMPILASMSPKIDYTGVKKIKIEHNNHITVKHPPTTTARTLKMDTVLAESIAILNTKRMNPIMLTPKSTNSNDAWACSSMNDIFDYGSPFASANTFSPSTSSMSGSYSQACSPENSRDSFDSARSSAKGGASSRKKRGRANSKDGPTDRNETSLGGLTRKFIEILESQPNGIVNLNDAATLLSVQKRRIYDITNVLEGIGLLRKTSKNNIQWRGGIFANQDDDDDMLEFDKMTPHYRQREPPPLELLYDDNKPERFKLKKEVRELGAMEERLDRLITIMDDSMNAFITNPRFPGYITTADYNMTNPFGDNTCIAVRCPINTELIIPESGLKLFFKNNSNLPIDAFVCQQTNQNSSSSSSPLQLHQMGGGQQSPQNSSEEENLVYGVGAVKETNEMFAQSSPVHSEYTSGYGSNLTPTNHLNQPPRVMVTLSESSPLQQEENELHPGMVEDDEFIDMALDQGKSGERYSHAMIQEDDPFRPMGSRASYLLDIEQQLQQAILLQQQQSASSSSTSSQSVSSNGQNLAPNNQSSSSSDHQSVGVPYIHSLIPLDPPVTEEDYNFTLQDHEGIVDLFDDSDLHLLDIFPDKKDQYFE